MSKIILCIISVIIIVFYILVSLFYKEFSFSSEVIYPSDRKDCSVNIITETPESLKDWVSRDVADKKFSSWFNKKYDVSNQNIIRYINSNQASIYEAEPIIRIENYDDANLKNLKSSLESGMAKYGFPGNTGMAIRYPLLKKAIIFDDSNGEFRLEMNEFKVFLSYEITLPNWNYPSETPITDVEVWKRYLCDLILHEKEHMEIARQATIEGIASTACLKAKNPDDFREQYITLWKQNSVKRRWTNMDYDARTNHGPRLKVQ